MAAGQFCTSCPAEPQVLHTYRSADGAALGIRPDTLACRLASELVKPAFTAVATPFQPWPSAKRLSNAPRSKTRLLFDVWSNLSAFMMMTFTRASSLKVYFGLFPVLIIRDGCTNTSLATQLWRWPAWYIPDLRSAGVLAYYRGTVVHCAFTAKLLLADERGFFLG